MGVIATWSNALEEAAVRQLDFGSQLVNQLGGAVCRTWRRHPNNIVFISPITRALMRHNCERLGEPPPSESVEPPLPFGAYAFNVRYTVYSITSDSNVEIEEASLYSCDRAYQGDIASFNYNYDNEESPYAIGISVLDSAGNETGIYGRNLGNFSYPLSGSASVEIIDCNSSQEPDVLPPEGIPETISITTINENGDTILNQEEYNITIPTTNNEIRFPVSIDVGGVDINIGLDGGSTSDGGSGSSEGSSGGDGSGVGVRQPFSPGNFRRVLPAGGQNSGTVETPEEQEESTELDEEITPETVFLVVTITTFPVGGRTQVQRNSVDSDYFAGYVVFYSGSGTDLLQGQQIPIRKESNLYEIPSWATGYRAYTVNGAKIKVANYVIPEEQ